MEDKMASRNKRRRHSEDSIPAFSSFNHVDRIRTNNKEVYTNYPRQCDPPYKYAKFYPKSLSNLDLPHSSKYQESVVSNASSGHRTRDLEFDLYEKLSLKRSKDFDLSANSFLDYRHCDNPGQRDSGPYSLEGSSLYPEEIYKKGKRKKELLYGTCANLYPEIRNNNASSKESVARNRSLEYDITDLTYGKSGIASVLTPDAEFTDQGSVRSVTEACSLRRTRSLAVIREESFADLQLNHGRGITRSQLIPRARLIEKNSYKDRYRSKFQTKDGTESVFSQSETSDVAQPQDNQSSHSEYLGSTVLSLPRSDCIQIPSKNRHCKSIVSSWPHYNESIKSDYKDHSSSVVNNRQDLSDVDSLDSNYFKHSNYGTNACSFNQDLTSEVAETTKKPLFILPDNYEDEDSVNDSEDSTESQEESLNYLKNPTYNLSLSRDNASLCNGDRSLTNYDILDQSSGEDNKLEDVALSENNFDSESSSREINSLTITKKDRGAIYVDHLQTIDNLGNSATDEEKIEPLSITTYESISFSSEEGSVNDFQDHLAVQQIPLKGELIKIQVEDYDEKTEGFVDVPLSLENPTPVENKEIVYSHVRKTLPTIISVEPKIEVFSENDNKHVEIDNPEIKIAHSKYASIRHKVIESHQNKSVNKIDINFKHRQPGSKLISTEPYVRTLLENQYYSLPDENISKSLRKSERIDEKLRRIDSEEGDSDICDSISRFGRANQRIRQREHCEIVSLGSISIEEQPKIEDTIDVRCEVSVLENENNKNAEEKYSPVVTTLKNSTVIEENNDTKILKSDSLSTTPIIQVYNSPKTVTISGRKVIIDDNLTKLYDNSNITDANKVKEESKITLADSHNSHQYNSSNRINFTQTVKQSIFKSLQNDEIKISRRLNQDSAKPIVIGCNNIKKLPPALIPKCADNENTGDFTGDNITYLDNSCVFNQTKAFNKPNDKLIDFNRDISLKKTKEVADNFKKTCEQIQHSISKNECFVNYFKNHTIKMSRPQVLNIIDSREKEKHNINELSVTETQNTISNQEQIENINGNKLPTLSKGTSEERLNAKKNVDISEKQSMENGKIRAEINEYQEKVDSVRCYWSKLIDKTKTSSLIDEDGAEVQNHVTSVEDMVKSIENVKTVESTRKQDDTNVWKRSSTDKSVDEPDYQSFCPSIEIIDLDQIMDRGDGTTDSMKHTTVIKSKSFEEDDSDFDHIRYKVINKDAFQKNIIGNYKKEAQFDGLMQYLQDYSFQELLINNNVVIIEPVRTKVQTSSELNKKYKTSNTCRITGATEKAIKEEDKTSTKGNSNLRRHFFYHPIRVNRELIDEELPNPDTVRNVRQLFENSLKLRTPSNDSNLSNKKSTSSKNLTDDTKINKILPRKKLSRYLTIDTSYGNKKWDSVSLSSGVSSGDLSSSYDYDIDGFSPKAHRENNENLYMSSSSEENLCESINTELCCDTHYVSQDVLEKIRECGTSVTYYGGKVVDESAPILSPMTKAIMDEIRGLQRSCGRDCATCKLKCSGEQCVCTKNSCENLEYTTSNSDEIYDTFDSTRNDKWKSMNFLESNDSKDSYLGVKFRLIKSNSCSSRLELVGTGKPTSKLYKNSDEDSVKSKINRLESVKTEPRIILSKCIEKKNDVKLEPFTINNQASPESVIKTESIVTVNNHIQLASTENGDVREKTGVKPMKMSRNKNVDLAFTLNRNEVKNKMMKNDGKNHANRKVEKANSIMNENTISKVNTSNKVEQKISLKDDLSKFENKNYNCNTKPLNKRRSLDDMEFEQFEVLECYDSLNHFGTKR